MEPAPLLSRRATNWTIVAIYTAIGVLLTSYRWLEDVSNHRWGTLLPRAIDEMTGALTAIVAVPIAVWLARRYPITRTTWVSGVLLAFLGALVYSAVHTTMMWGTRVALYPLFGQGRYDYGIMIFRYPMEASNDVMSFAFILALVYAWRGLSRARKTELEAAELQAKLADAQLENLRLQLNPHFLFNTLNAISSVMYEDVGKADAMIAKLSDFLRLVLDSGGVQQVPLGEELDVERKYVDIMRARLEQRLTLDVAVDDAARDALVPFMILQPLLENSIRHGVEPSRGALEIRVAVSRDNGSTIVSVADDGIGLSSVDEASNGRGLALVRARLEYLFGPSAEFAIASPPSGGTRATLRFPFTPAKVRA